MRRYAAVYDAETECCFLVFRDDEDPDDMWYMHQFGAMRVVPVDAARMARVLQAVENQDAEAGPK